MAIALKDLADRLGATLVRGNPGAVIDAVSSLTEAGPRTIAPFTDAKYIAELQQTRAGAVLAKCDVVTPPTPADTALLSASDPELAFIQATALLHPEMPETPGVDPRAVVEEDVQLGSGCHVGPYAVLRRGARLGDRCVVMAHSVVGRNCVLGSDCRLYANVVLYDKVHMGNRVTVHSGTVIGADGFGYKFRGGKHVKVPQIGTVEIGDDVEIGSNSCIDRGALSPTRIGSGSKIDNIVQIGHGVTIGKHCILCGQSGIAGSVTLDDYVVLGANAGIADHLKLGKGAKVGAKSGVGRDVPPGGEVFGMFAEERKLAFRQIAAIRRLPELIERIRELERELSKIKAGESASDGGK